jgi:hypothetical protein
MQRLLAGLYAFGMRWLIQNERTLRMIYSGISGAIGKSGWNPWGILISWYRYTEVASKHARHYVYKMDTCRLSEIRFDNSRYLSELG